jgi:cytoskeleton protein RodZ
MTEQDPNPSSTQTAGAQLAQTRKERGLSVADVAAKLRIGSRQIEALEADDFDRLPGHTIARGFVRNYARFLQLDPEIVLKAFDKQTTNTVASRITLRDQNVQFSESGMGHRNRPLLRLTLGILVLTALAYLAWRWDGNFGPSANPATPSTSANSSTAKVVIQPLPVTIAPELVAPAATGGLGVVMPTTPASPGALPSSLAESVVHLAFDGASWVEVRDRSGKVVWLKNNPGGTEQDITASPPLSFTIGNAAKVKMTYNGDAFDLTPHIQGDIARFKIEQ